MTLSAGDWVEVRAKEEILASLDKDGRLESMPFMPEMFALCGKRLRVHRRAHKSCDTINPISSRSLPHSVTLDGVRCSGAGHGGCQAACAIFWKEAWLKPVDGAHAAESKATPAQAAAICTEADVERATQDGVNEQGKIRYRCQATDFPLYSTILHARDLAQYGKDLASANIGLVGFVMTVTYFTFALFMRPQSPRFGGLGRWLYDRARWIWGGAAYPRRRGLLRQGDHEPLSELNLQPGEYVRVKSYDDILKTINSENKNRGLFFDAEMVPYCGGVFRVRSRVHHFIDEWTGVMRNMKTPAIILEQVWCRSRYSNKRLFCPRAIYSWWREAWLERAPEASEVSIENADCARTILKELAKEQTPA